MPSLMSPTPIMVERPKYDTLIILGYSEFRFFKGATFLLARTPVKCLPMDVPIIESSKILNHFHTIAPISCLLAFCSIGRDFRTRFCILPIYSQS